MPSGHQTGYTFFLKDKVGQAGLTREETMLARRKIRFKIKCDLDFHTSTVSVLQISHLKRPPTKLAAIRAYPIMI